MGCSSTKTSKPCSPLDVPTKNIKDIEGEKLNGSGDEINSNSHNKENVQFSNDPAPISSSNVEEDGSPQSVRKDSFSSFTTNDASVLNIEETDEQANKDIDQLHEVLEAEEVNEKTLVRMLVPIHCAYRNLLQKKYKDKFSKILLNEILKKGPAACKALFEKLFLPIEEFLAVWLHQLVKIGNLLLIVELLTVWSPSIVIDIKRSYAQEYRVSFEEDLKNSLDGHVSSSVKVILLSLAVLQRVDDATEIDGEVSIFESDELSKGRDQIVEVLTQKSYSKTQLAAIFKEYKQKYYLDIRDSIDIEFEDDAQKILTGLVNMSENSTLYLANELQEIFNGAKPQTDRVLFLIVGRCEIDLSEIHKAYFEKLARTLQHEIEKKYSGITRYALLMLVNKFGGI